MYTCHFIIKNCIVYIPCTKPNFYIGMRSVKNIRPPVMELGIGYTEPFGKMTVCGLWRCFKWRSGFVLWPHRTSNLNDSDRQVNLTKLRRTRKPTTTGSCVGWGSSADVSRQYSCPKDGRLEMSSRKQGRELRCQMSRPITSIKRWDYLENSSYVVFTSQ